MRRLLLSLSLGTLLLGCGGMEAEEPTPAPTPAEQAVSEDPSRSAQQGQQCWCGYWCTGNENYCLQYCHNICLDQTT